MAEGEVIGDRDGINEKGRALEITKPDSSVMRPKTCHKGERRRSELLHADENISPLLRARRAYHPRFPAPLKDLTKLQWRFGKVCLPPVELTTESTAKKIAEKTNEKTARKKTAQKFNTPPKDNTKDQTCAEDSAEGRVDDPSAGTDSNLAALFPKSWGQRLVTFAAAPAIKSHLGDDPTSDDPTAGGPTDATTGKRTPMDRAPWQRLTGRPLRVAVVLSGGQAPGGHNVITGIFDALKAMSKEASVIGYRGGPAGILADDKFELTADYLAPYRNTGGFDLLGSGRGKIETPEQFELCRKNLEDAEVDALVIIGGDDSNTNAALLAEDFLQKGSKVQVLGVPKTIDGDLKNDWVDISFGFDTASRLYSELIANIAKDALSAKKYYHFIRLMGRAASHITLEAALQTQPNIALISEEVAARQQTLRDIVEDLGQTIKERAAGGVNYGIVLVPEGLIEFIPEMASLINELNDLLAKHRVYIDSLSGFTSKSEFLNRKLSRDSSYTFSTLPIDIQRQLLMDRDPHGNVQVSRIETERLLIEMLQTHLGEARADGHYTGKFSTQRHFLGYEGRCAAPSNFDADYAYSLGQTAVALTATGVSGYMSVIKGLGGDRSDWQALGVPLTAMLNLEKRHGQDKPVIRKCLVSLEHQAFKTFASQRTKWAREDHYRFAGPLQYFGPKELVDRPPAMLTLERRRSSDRPW